MSEINNNNERTEQSVEESIEETGGIPEISVSLEVSGMTQTAVDKTLSIEDMAADANATGDAIANVADDLLDLAADVGEIQDWTGEDIPVSSAPGASSIATAIASIVGESYPVGSIYMTTSIYPPKFTGTWVEIAITATWAQLKVGQRGYAPLEEGQTGGPVHFWLRIE